MKIFHFERCHVFCIPILLFWNTLYSARYYIPDFRPIRAFKYEFKHEIVLGNKSYVSTNFSTINNSYFFSLPKTAHHYLSLPKTPQINLNNLLDKDNPNCDESATTLTPSKKTTIIPHTRKILGPYPLIHTRKENSTPETPTFDPSADPLLES